MKTWTPGTRSRWSRWALLCTVTALLCGLLPTAATAATGTVDVRGSVRCPSGEPVSGVWVKSSSGRSGFATLRKLPNGRQAVFVRTLTDVTLPTTVTINVGCGIKDGNQWEYVYNGLGGIKATASGTVFINVTCSTSKCSKAPKGTGGSATVNPAAESTSKTLYGKEWCTYRASQFWKQMTGTYPGWGGDAGEWDNSDRAPKLGWSVTSYPEPDTLMIEQPTKTNSAGHVRYVADVRVKDGKVQVKYYDRNGDGLAYDGVIFDRGPKWPDTPWLDVPSTAQFIRVPPRFTAHRR